MKSKFWIVKMPKYSIIIFCILNIIASLLYPGGTLNDPEQTSYLFTRNFLSDLGTTISYSGAKNTISCILFNTSIFISGFTFIMLFYKVKDLFHFKLLSNIATLFGILGGVCFIGVACTPADILLDPHIFFAHGIFRCLFISIFFYSILIFKTKGFDNKYGYGFVLFGIMVLIYIFISEVGPDPRTHPTALTLQVISQKTIAIWLLFSIYIYSIGLGKYIYRRV